MTINWKQGLFAAALLLSVSLLFVGCSKNKTDKAVADKSTGEIIGEEIDVIEVVPAKTANEKNNAVKEQKAGDATAPAQPNNEAPAMTPPTTTPAPTSDAPTTTPEPSAVPDAAPSSTTSDVTITTSCSETLTEQNVADNGELVIESESAYCCNYCQSEAACSPACTPAVEACQPACDAAPACAPDPVCAPEPACVPACIPACIPECIPRCAPYRHHHIRRGCRPCHMSCRTRNACIRDCSPCCSACDSACVTACASACDPACKSDGCTNDDCTAAWSNEPNAPANSSQDSSPSETRSNRKTELPDPQMNEDAQKANASSAVGSTPKAPQAPSIVLPEAK